jgi:NarL family two-component system response regulator LiaR
MDDMSEPIRVLIVDDHDMVRAGLATFLEVSDDLELIAEARNGRDAIRACEQTLPDVILMDLVMPEMDGVTATQEIRKRWPQIQVVALTSFQDGDLVQQALQAGAIGYLLKNTNIQALTNAIRQAHAGKSTLAHEALQALVESRQHPPEPEVHLTPRELEVLALMVEGLNNPAIAERLVISIGTTRSHVSNILSKLGVSNRAEAITLALRRKIIS